MSYNLGQPFIQICFTVDDVDAECKRWAEAVGAGPWARYPEVPFKGPIKFKGEPVEMQQGGAVGYWGSIEIELYRRNDGSPAHAIFPDHKGSAFHHMCMMAKPGEYWKEIERLEGLGYKRVWECVVDQAGQDMNICWLDTTALNGAMIELYEYNETMLAGKQYGRQMHENWDGKELYYSYTPDPE